MKHSPKRTVESFPLKRFEELIVKAQKENLLSKYKEPEWTPELIQRIRNIVDASKVQQPPPTNPFRITGWQPKENQINDALADLLSPSPDVMGRKILSELLQFLAKSGDVQSELILKQVSDVTHAYSVRREYPVGQSRPDIAIFSSKFAIFLENKMRYGSETFFQDRFQTERQADLLQSFGNGRNIPLDHRMGILLTPTGTAPKQTTHYRSITTKDFCNAARRAVLDCYRDIEGQPHFEDARTILSLAFLWAYEDAS